ncbi:MAG: M23 family metallopeptidase [Alphaproteobacteria bacterium]|nr:M23 family metallopeptidase [Alphaproteobacteria bacterium]
MMPRLTCLILAFLAATISPGVALEITRGQAVQGGLIILTADPSSRLTLDGEALMMTADGHAVVGFHRDDTAAITIIETRQGDERDRLVLTPATRTYKEQRINGLPGKMVTPPEEVLARIKRDREVVKSARAHATAIGAFAEPFIWPAHGIITGVYGSRRILNDEPRAPHYGIDIAAAKGTPVVAPQSGVIRMVEDLYFTGWTIILDHGHGVSSTFLHLDTTNAQAGQTVQQGEVIGTVGSTGRSTGPHLDWRINLFGKRLDPALLVGEMPE